MTTETISGRAEPRYTGPPLTHQLRYYAPPEPLRGYRPGAIIARCDGCRPRWQAVIDGGHATADLVRLERQHAGLEDP